MDYFLKFANANPLILGIDHNIDTLTNKTRSIGSSILNYTSLSPKIRKMAERIMLVNADLSKSLSIRKKQRIPF